MSIHYDPTLAKVFSYAPIHRQSMMVLTNALSRARLHGVRTNRELLVNVLRHPAFLDGATDITFFDIPSMAKRSAPLADNKYCDRLSALVAVLTDTTYNHTLVSVFVVIPSG